MMKKYLMVEIEEITPELLEKFKASGEWILAFIVSELWVGKAPARKFKDVQIMHFVDDAWTDGDATYHEPTHYLPDGLPDPSAAVEVFEREVTTDSADWLCANPTEKMIGCAHIFAPENMEVGDMVGVFLLPEVSK
jgi:hypothetical protein